MSIIIFLLITWSLVLYYKPIKTSDRKLRMKLNKMSNAQILEYKSNIDKILMQSLATGMLFYGIINIIQN